ncbi:MAG: EscU/YscU/HrcU family type III secretion system export apparatus switch protein [Clostridiales bacterium]|jgi:flagellar biosynthesis protein|nr:EscU/YscU/HrcU family type III secretion system export apparatus switch protein [Eubacteriales bacterium]MDH7565115.1 EscU/YscU/HrcU family type III secretion system export apparatus switch protein [Clostridiales bacterium]
MEIKSEGKDKKINKKKVKEVAALSYSPQQNQSPEIVALGRGETAEKILELAKSNNVPVYKDPELAHTLNKLRIGDEIPPELYEVVAEILVFISHIDKSCGEKNGLKQYK